MCNSSGQSQTTHKAILRRKLRDARAEHSAYQRSAFDQAIRAHILQLIERKASKRIAAYWSFDAEPDITPLCEQLLAHGLQLSLPLIADKPENGMEFRAWQADSKLLPNRCGIFEPQDTAVIPVESLDLLLIPLVGYDNRGNRLGMGAGYYDRQLEAVRNSPTPLRVGVAYSVQETARINPEKHDIPLHGLVNECGWYQF